ncbi:energy-coupling factor transporter ATPase [Bacillaceae bacterium S4-13-56]
MEAPVLEVQNLSFRYDQRKTEETLSDITFSLTQGEWLAVIGHNGSGKSTLAQLLVGLLEPHRGKVSIAGVPMSDQTKWEARRHIGLVFQNPDHQFVGTSVQDDIAFGLENINMPYEEMKENVDRALGMVGLTQFRFHDPSRLSGGQKQRVAIAGILAFKPSILVLDEALVMLDPKSRREVLGTLRQLQEKENITIISITHDMNEAAHSDRVIMLESGRIVKDGDPRVIFSECTGLEAPLGEKLRRELERRGRKVPPIYMSEEEMVKWICKSHLPV